jgi:crotonobetainyl-CoA:carnitine CoA-transferase CaiB-like acyl-CoA transferase
MHATVVAAPAPAYGGPRTAGPTTKGTRTMSTARHTATPTAPTPGEEGPGAGVRVLDLGTVYAAPITAMLLGDYGADVLKIEHPRGDPARTHGPSKDGHGLWWKVISRNKRTATLVLSRAEGQEIMQRLVADADVLIENFRPGVMEKWGLGPERLLEINPDLVMLRVTGFGQAGPYAQRRAYDQLGAVPGRHGNRSTNNAPRNAYRTRDGRWVAISASATSVAERVMDVVGRPDIAAQPWFASARERVRHADQLDGIVAEWIGARAFDAVMRAFQQAGAAIAPIYDTEQVVNDPHVRART